MNKINNPELEGKVVQCYLNNESMLSIQRKFKVSECYVLRVLRDNHVIKRTQSKHWNPNLIEDYFHRIDTEEKAYWLGWLITDGGISDKDFAIQLCLKKEDIDILHQFEKDLGVENKVKNFNSDYSRFCLCSKEICNDLKQYGLVQNKTFTITIPQINEKLYPALLRGLFDGDGGISIMNSRNRIEYELSFTGNLNCVSKVNELISELTGLPKRTITKNNSIFRIRWSSSKHIIKICSILYNNSGDHKLLRKYNKFLQIKENTEVN